MGLLSNLFKPLKSQIEGDLEKIYIQFLSQKLGWPYQQAREEIRKAIKICKQQGEKEGTTKMSGDFGDTLIEVAKKGNETCKSIVNKALKEGATEDDIKEWWNLDDLQRRMVLWSEEVFRYANFLSYTENGQSADEAMNKVRKMFPMYGDPDDTKHFSGKDILLPNELRGRVDKYREKYGAQLIQEKVKNYSTYNALVRDEIEAGNL